tara:strand:+ start:4093 stop:4305 length:213 start_codon:yes stop_codon:yes gene_type:complete
MKLSKTKVQSNSVTLFQILGGLLILFAIVDFAVSWMGYNLTPFMGAASRFSPIIFGLVGSALVNIDNSNS